jgi:hypothetical protein
MVKAANPNTGAAFFPSTGHQSAMPVLPHLANKVEQPAKRGRKVRLGTPTYTIDWVARSVANGFSFGPRKICVGCAEKIDDLDLISRGICSRCWAAIEEATPC